MSGNTNDPVLNLSAHAIISGLIFIGYMVIVGISVSTHDQMKKNQAEAYNSNSSDIEVKGWIGLAISFLWALFYSFILLSFENDLPKIFLTTTTNSPNNIIYDKIARVMLLAGACILGYSVNIGFYGVYSVIGKTTFSLKGDGWYKDGYK